MVDLLMAVAVVVLGIVVGFGLLFQERPLDGLATIMATAAYTMFLF
jgi:hypothetical protein